MSDSQAEPVSRLGPTGFDPSRGDECTLGVGDGGGKLFVHGSYDAIKRVQSMIFRLEAATARLGALIPPPEEVRVLAEMSEDIIYPAKRLAEWTRLPEKRVREILRGFKSRGWAWYDVSYNEDEYCVSGSGYSLSPDGSAARTLIDAIAMEARQGGNEVPSRSDDSAAPSGDRPEPSTHQDRDNVK